MTEYEQFINSKTKIFGNNGFDTRNIIDGELELFDFQKAIVKWACKKGRAAIFADTGMGKTAMQAAWAYAVHQHSGNRVLIIAPLCVAKQTVREAKKFGVKIKYARKIERDEYGNFETGIYITNYEMIENFELDSFPWFDGIVLDESSILKHHTSKTRNRLIELCQNIPYRLACTATPSPNDFMEIGNHAEFLGVMGHSEMLAMFFTHDGAETSKWRLKGHGRRKFFEWMATWAVMFKTPSDIGFSEDAEKYKLPNLIIKEHVVKTGLKQDGQLFATEAKGITEKSKAKRDTINVRISKAEEIQDEIHNESCIIWCHRNDEHDALCESFPTFSTASGSDSIEFKESQIESFTNGISKGIITKPSIAGFGMNWQHCHNMIFVGLTDSFEELYQAIRRCYRFGQKHDVTVHLITTDVEMGTLRNLKRKQDQVDELSREMAKQISEITKENINKTTREKANYMTDQKNIHGNALYLGDSVEITRSLPDQSIDYSIFSPPFASLYVSSNSDRDMGNVKSDEEFMAHFDFLVKELFRIIKNGRLVSFHCMNIPTSKERDGYIGLKDFRGNLIRVFQNAGFIYHSEVCIWKDPVTAIPDYVVTMRKPGENLKPISHDAKQFPVDLWQKIASPIWMDINPSNTLNYRAGRENEDERHICPLQLDVINRMLALYTTEGDVVLSPFMGVGSEGYCAVKYNRKFIGCELKPSYFAQAVKNIETASEESIDLFSLIK
jgi:DNA modification methylase